MPRQNRAWISLLAFCALHAVASALGLAVLFMGVAMFATAQSGDPSAAPSANPPARMTDAAVNKTFAGVVTDSNCRAKHASDSGQSPAECVKSCVRNGSKYTLVNGDQAYTLEGSATDFERVAGQRAKIVGALEGNTIRVRSVTTTTK